MSVKIAGLMTMKIDSKVYSDASRNFVNGHSNRHFRVEPPVGE